MRWSEYAVTLSPDEYECLVNTFTAGCGSTALAVRGLAANPPLTAVFTALAAAQTQLRTASRLLTTGPGMTLLTATPVEIPATPLHWRDLIAGLTPYHARLLLSILGVAVRSARQAGESVVVDGPVEEIRAQLRAAVRALATARRLVAQVNRV